jgi:multidrug efflux pump subunit AcrA (membrane-fusion protein)
MDSILTQEEFFSYLSSVSESNKGDAPVSESTKDRIFKFMNREDKLEMAKLEELQALLSAETEARAQASSTLAAQMELVASLQSQLEVFKQAQADAQKAAAEALLANRKAALSECVPEADLETHLEKFSALDEDTFMFMVGQLKTAKEARAESFKAVGSEGVEVETVPKTVTDVIRETGVEAAKARRA